MRQSPNGLLVQDQKKQIKNQQQNNHTKFSLKINKKNQLVQKQKQEQIQQNYVSKTDKLNKCDQIKVIKSSNQKNINIQANQNDEKSIQQETLLNQIAKKLLPLIKSQIYFFIYTFSLILFLVNSILEACQINQQITFITNSIQIGLQIFFSLTIIVKIINYKEEQIFLLFLDILTNICAYITFSITNEQINRYFKAVRTLRIFLMVKQSNLLHIQTIKLLNSLRSVGKILIPAAMFIYFYAVVGLYSFRDYEYNKCRDPNNKLLTNNWSVYTDSIFLCGQKSCPVVNGIQYECLNPVDYGVQPNQKQVINIMQGNGLMRYNNIFFALFSTFKQMFVTGSSRLMLMGKQVLNQYYALLYYLSFCYLLSYIYLNIFYGLLMSNGGQSNQENQLNYDIKIQQSQALTKNNKDSTRKLYKKKNRNQINKQNFQSVPIQSGQNSLYQQQQIQHKSNIKFAIKRITTEQSICNQQINNDLTHRQINISKKNKGQNISKKSDRNIGDQFQKKQQKDFNIRKIDTQKSFQEKNNSQIQPQIAQIYLKNQTLNSIRKNQQQKFDNIFAQAQIIDNKNQQSKQKYKYIMKKYFFINHIIVILCTLNICIDYQGQHPSVRYVTDVIDFTFFFIYLCEIIFRFLIHRKYVPNQSYEQDYKLDFVLFILVCCGMVYEASIANNILEFVIASDHLSLLLRTMKYLRIVNLLTSSVFFVEARIIFRSTFQAIYEIRHFALLWLFILLVFSIMGYHLFHDKMKVDPSGNLDMKNGKQFPVSYQGFLNSIIFTVFAFFNQEWDWFLFQQYPGAGFLVVIWQLLSLLIGLQIMSKYFMALLMNQLGQKLDKQSQLIEQNSSQNDQQSEQNQYQNQIQNNLNKITPFESKGSQKFMQIKIKESQNQIHQSIHNLFTLRTSKKNNLKQSNKQSTKRNTQKLKQLIQSQSQSQNEKQYKNNNVNPFQKHQKQVQENGGQYNYQDQKDLQKQSNVIQISKKKSKIFMTSKFYSHFKMFFIFVSIVCTLLMNPRKDPKSQEMKVYQVISFITILFFGIQIVLSMLTFGFFQEKNGYFTKLMNWIYFIIFIIQVLNLFPSLAKNYTIQKLICFRILRIFVLVQMRYLADKEMRITIVGFWKLLPKVFNLLTGTLILYGFFAIILVKIYKDDFYYCESHSSLIPIDTVQDCFNWGGNWIQRKMNVSNIFQSLLYLFLLATTQGWSTQVIQASSLRGNGMQPVQDSNQIMYFFFSAFFFFGNMVMLNVFLGLSVYNFKKIKDQVTGLNKLTEDDKMWLSIKNNIYRMHPKMSQNIPDNILSQIFHSFINSKSYKIINVFLFVLFIINMSLFETNMKQYKQMILTIVLHIFVGIFLFQYLITFIAYGIKILKRKKFIFETLGVLYIIISYIIIFNTYLDSRTNRIMYGLIICLLCIRYFTLLNDIQFIKKMINSLITIFPQTSNIWLLIFVVLITYATIGIRIFGNLRVYSQLNDFDQNYTTLDKAIFALIKFSILQSPIGQIIDAASKSQPNAVCFQINDYQQYALYGRMGCGSKFYSYLFFLTFHLIYTLILMSTLMAVIFDAYSQVRRQEQSMVNKFQLQELKNQWTNYDPEATGYISYRDFWMFTGKLIKIYKIDQQSLMSNESKHSFLKNMNIPIYQDQNGILSFQFHEVVESLTRIVIKQKKAQFWDTTRADKQFKAKNNIQGFKMMKKSVYDSSHVLTLIALKSGLKSWKRKVVKMQNGKSHNNIFNFVTRISKQKIDISINQISNIHDQKVIQSSKQSNEKSEPKFNNKSQTIIEKDQQVKHSKSDLKIIMNTKQKQFDPEGQIYEQNQKIQKNEVYQFSCSIKKKNTHELNSQQFYQQTLPHRSLSEYGIILKKQNNIDMNHSQTYNQNKISINQQQLIKNKQKTKIKRLSKIQLKKKNQVQKKKNQQIKLENELNINENYQYKNNQK